MPQPLTAQEAEEVLASFTSLFLSLSPSPHSWAQFWKDFSLHRPPFLSQVPDSLTTDYSRLLCLSLTTLGQDHPATRKFLSTVPLRYSKTVFFWPPTSDMMQELTTD